MTPLIAACAAIAAALLTGLVRRLELEHGLLDIPNERSSHSVPTPRGGGIAIALVVSVACIGLWLLGSIAVPLLMALLGGLAVAVVGLVDDRLRLKAGPRFIVHVSAALWALGWLGGLPALQLGAHVYSIGIGGYVLGVLGIVWVLNLFNFMDGIDGLAASEAIFITWAGGLLAGIAVVATGVAPAAWVTGAACGGFLLWNWPPARIFMGDVGSGYLGYVIAVLAVASTHATPSAWCVWLILGGVFWVDATLTLVRRFLRGEALNEAHRRHAYQWLARRWGQHRRVTLVTMTVNLLWLLPWAALAELYPRWAAACTLAALAPVCVLAFAAGAGRPERVT